jgi:hypothetical protein
MNMQVMGDNDKEGKERQDSSEKRNNIMVLNK